MVKDTACEEKVCVVCGTPIKDSEWAKEGIHETCLISEMEYFEYIDSVEEN